MRNKHRYPDNWESISLNVRNDANWTCEQCGKPCRKPGESVSDFSERLPDKWLSEIWELIFDDDSGEYTEVWKPIRFCLTVAHLDHNEKNCDRHNLKALCAPCHLKYDAFHHAESRKKNKRLKQEKAGQLTLNLGI